MTTNEYGVAEFDDPHGAAFAATVRAILAAMPERDRLPRLLRRLAEETSLFAAPRDASPAPALRLLAYDGLLTEILGEEIRAGRLAPADLDSLGQLIEDEAAAAGRVLA